MFQDKLVQQASEADYVKYYNTGSAIAAGDVVVVGKKPFQRIGIAFEDIAATTGEGIVQIGGRFNLTRVAGAASSFLDPYYWDTTAAGLTTVGNSQIPFAGHATERVAATTVTELELDLDGIRPNFEV